LRVGCKYSTMQAEGKYVLWALVKLNPLLPKCLCQHA